MSTIRLSTRGMTVLAQDAARSMDPEQGLCRQLPHLWEDAEKALTPDRAKDDTVCDQAIAQATTACGACPLTGPTGPCARWAQLDSYTGVAGGVAFFEGRPVPSQSAVTAA